MKFATIIPAAPGFVFIDMKQNWSSDVIAWGFTDDSAMPYPITVMGPQPRKGNRMFTPADGQVVL